jgi:hypothetical protein
MGKDVTSLDQFITEAKKNEPHELYQLDREKLRYAIGEFKEIADNGITDTDIKLGFSTACVIAFTGRHKIVEFNVKLLNKQSLVPAIILVVSNLADSFFAKQLSKTFNNVFVTHHQNYPIGGKWNAGVEYAQKLGVNGLMILGSDDLLSLDYFKTCYNAIDSGKGSKGNGVDLIGNRSWLIYDVSKKMYQLEYKPIVNMFLGGGRMFSKNFLDSVNWQIFRKYRPMHLDGEGHEKVKKFSNSMELIDKSNFILSIKGNWEVINSTKRILDAKHRISWNDITSNRNSIFNMLQIKDYETLSNTIM